MRHLPVVSALLPLRGVPSVKPVQTRRARARVPSVKPGYSYFDSDFGFGAERHGRALVADRGGRLSPEGEVHGRGVSSPTETGSSCGCLSGGPLVAGCKAAAAGELGEHLVLLLLLFWLLMVIN
jgi:hypothetical protein